MLLAFSIAPSGTGDPDGSVTEAVAAAVRIVRASGLPNRTDAMFTTLEGSWQECMDVVKQCVDAMEPYGNRVSLVMKADIRPGFEHQLDAKVERVERALAAGENSENS